MLHYFFNTQTLNPTQDLILLKKLGKGSFGVVYLCMNNKTQKLVALKVEQIKNDHQLLKQENKIYQLLNKIVDGPFPQIHQFITDQDYNIMEMQLLGPSFDKTTIKNERFTNFLLFNNYLVQMIQSIQHVHQLGYVHRDIKPDNFLLDTQDNKKVYLIDFGLIKKFINDKGEHIPFKSGLKICGTPRYASINTHFGYELSRRDDFISLGYTVLYCLKGRLPWQNTLASTHMEKIKKIEKKKLQFSVKKLFEGLPIEYETFFNYVKSLEFEAQPDYAYLIRLFKNSQQVSQESEDQEQEYEYNQYRLSEQIDSQNFHLNTNNNLSLKQQIERLQQ